MEKSANARMYEAIPQLGRLRDEVLYNDVWKQPELGPRDRSLVTCAVLAALGKNEELAHHMRRAVENGVTADELRGLVVQVGFYAGWPCAVNAGKAGLALFEGEA
ncbi:carboxymuconolactone decarboxylase family protein [Celeribacter indicus]|uniref:Carboxymuconolactone decarboxylase n=1 Tax=Celeribacter indicus TaxID=1208324 RepID=A0A0B5E7X6_9RHOB|nr:carboxymuconolactone decarboxylase family protein [Celeribacter indicus]AJE49141.1 carboxymuconolactone decarboxylase [Celeribacter indicus]SDX17438.1 4-carboxymuconolactone decarboxylase [Celeribacter indicus]